MRRGPERPWRVEIGRGCGGRFADDLPFVRPGESGRWRRFCGECGAALTSESVAEVRKTVTIVFCDLVGSTALGERSDPEVLRELMSRYHAELRAILERHGGTVEKFVGRRGDGHLRPAAGSRGRRAPCGAFGGRDARRGGSTRARGAGRRQHGRGGRWDRRDARDRRRGERRRAVRAERRGRRRADRSHDRAPRARPGTRGSQSSPSP